MILPPHVERAIDQCYDAIVAPARWTAALDDLAFALGAKACSILPHELNDRQSDVVGSTGMQKLDELWQRNLDWVKPVFEPRGDAFVRGGYESILQSHLFTDDDIRHSRFHNEISGPAGLKEWACGIFTADGRYWCMPFFRGTEPFTPELLEPLAEVSRRVARAVSISSKVSRTVAEAEVKTLEKLGCAAVLLDHHGRVTRANHFAEDLFCSEFGVRHGRLWTAESANVARLSHYMTQIEHCGPGGCRLPRQVVISRNGFPWLLIEAMPVTSAALDVFGGCRAILMISDVTRPEFREASLLILAFGLTAAEARLAAALGAGCEFAEATASFGISPHTARSQLKAIFAKTGTRRQAELAAVIARLRSIRHH